MLYDFLYIDTDRLQSLLAQLEEGVIEQVITSSNKEGSLNVDAGLLAKLLPINFGGDASIQHSTQYSKVLNDYAFIKLLKLLKEKDKKHRLILDMTDTESITPIHKDYTGFVLVRGKLSILDYTILQNILSNTALQSSLGIPSDQTLMQIKDIIQTFMADSLQIRLYRIEGKPAFSGPLIRDFLREDIRNVILKYGNNQRKDWVMLAQINTIPSQASNKINGLDAIGQSISTSLNQGQNFSTLKDILDKMIVFLNEVQEAIASISYPDVAVTPIGIYREIQKE